MFQKNFIVPILSSSMLNYEFRELHDDWKRIKTKMSNLLVDMCDFIDNDTESDNTANKREVLNLIYHHGFMVINIDNMEPKRHKKYDEVKLNINKMHEDTAMHENDARRLMLSSA